MKRLAAVAAAAALVVTSCADDADSSRSSGSNREPDTAPTIGMVRLTTVATADSPTAMTARPDHDEIYVAERAGRVRLARPLGARLDLDDRPVLDLTDEVASLDGERGLLGLTFSPDGARLVVSYTDGNDDGASVVASYAMDGERPDPASRIEILRIAQPYANHNGGDLAFGPDGFLYLGYGDGGSADDPENRAQALGTLLGKLLRIDVSGSTADRPYTIPPDNPFVGVDGARGEIWAYGLRNPWRFSFDSETGDLWIGDVGQNQWEEIDRLRATPAGAGRGANLGWPLYEGTHETEKGAEMRAAGHGLPDDAVGPVLEYSHDDGLSVTGGLVIRGNTLPGLRGAYVFSDFGAAKLLAITGADEAAPGADSVAVETTGTALTQVVSFATDGDDRVYVLCLTGEIVRLDAV